MSNEEQMANANAACVNPWSPAEPVCWHGASQLADSDDGEIKEGPTSSVRGCAAWTRGTDTVITLVGALAYEIRLSHLVISHFHFFTAAFYCADYTTA